MKRNSDIEEGLEVIRTRKKRVYIVFSIMFLSAVLLEFLDSPEIIQFTIVALGVITLMPLMRWLSLSTCPKCYSNFFGIIANINKTKCSNCGLELNKKTNNKIDEKEPNFNFEVQH